MKNFDSNILKNNMLKIDKIFRDNPKEDNITFLVDGKQHIYNRKEFYYVLDIFIKKYGW